MEQDLAEWERRMLSNNHVSCRLLKNCFGDLELDWNCIKWSSVIKIKTVWTSISFHDVLLEGLHDGEQDKMSLANSI